MKQKTILFPLLAALLLSACSAQPAPAPQQPDSESSLVSQESDAVTDNSSAGEDLPEEPAPDASADLDDRLVVMDAMLYRGVVSEIGEAEDGYSLLINRVDGTGYAFASLNAVTDEYTRANFELDDLRTGRHIEVYYGDSLDGKPVTVIAANLLPDAELSVYNGELVLIELSDDGSGMMELLDRGGDGSTVFHFDDSTQFYMNMDDLEPGMELNIFHSGRMTRSIPPQGFALEVRPFTAHE